MHFVKDKKEKWDLGYFGSDSDEEIIEQIVTSFKRGSTSTKTVKGGEIIDCKTANFSSDGADIRLLGESPATAFDVLPVVKRLERILEAAQARILANCTGSDVLTNSQEIEDCSTRFSKNEVPAQDKAGILANTRISDLTDYVVEFKSELKPKRWGHVAEKTFASVLAVIEAHPNIDINGIAHSVNICLSQANHTALALMDAKIVTRRKVGKLYKYKLADSVDFSKPVFTTTELDTGQNKNQIVEQEPNAVDAKNSGDVIDKIETNFRIDTKILKIVFRTIAKRPNTTVNEIAHFTPLTIAVINEAALMLLKAGLVTRQIVNRSYRYNIAVPATAAGEDLSKKAKGSPAQVGMQGRKEEMVHELPANLSLPDKSEINIARNILACVSDCPHITANGVAEKLRIHVSQVRRLLKKLEETRVIKHTAYKHGDGTKRYHYAMTDANVKPYEEDAASAIRERLKRLSYAERKVYDCFLTQQTPADVKRKIGSRAWHINCAMIKLLGLGLIKPCAKSPEEYVSISCDFPLPTGKLSKETLNRLNQIYVSFGTGYFTASQLAEVIKKGVKLTSGWLAVYSIHFDKKVNEDNGDSSRYKYMLSRTTIQEFLSDSKKSK